MVHDRLRSLWMDSAVRGASSLVFVLDLKFLLIRAPRYLRWPRIQSTPPVAKGTLRRLAGTPFFETHPRGVVSSSTNIPRGISAGVIAVPAIQVTKDSRPRPRKPRPGSAAGDLEGNGLKAPPRQAGEVVARAYFVSWASSLAGSLARIC